MCSCTVKEVIFCLYPHELRYRGYKMFNVIRNSKILKLTDLCRLHTLLPDWQVDYAVRQHNQLTQSYPDLPVRSPANK